MDADSLIALEGVASAFAGARDGVDVVLRDRGLRRTAPDLTAESLLRGAVSSAALEGSASGDETIREGAGDAVAQAAVRVSTETLGLVPVLDRSPLQAFARLHAVAAAGAVGADELGRPRGPEQAAALQRLARWMLGTGSAPAMLVAAVVHADLATSAPFASHNGIVARAAERLVLVARGVDEKSLLVPEAAHRRLRAPYESNLRGYVEGEGSSGVHAWLLYAAEAYALAAEVSPVHDRL